MKQIRIRRFHVQQAKSLRQRELQPGQHRPERHRRVHLPEQGQRVRRRLAQLQRGLHQVVHQREQHRRVQLRQGVHHRDLHHQDRHLHAHRHPVAVVEDDQLKNKVKSCLRVALLVYNGFLGSRQNLLG